LQQKSVGAVNADNKFVAVKKGLNRGEIFAQCRYGDGARRTVQAR
jgi:hypothetical protein